MITIHLLRFPSKPEIDEKGYIVGEWLGKPFGGLLLPKREDLALACPYQAGDLFEGRVVIDVKAVTARNIYITPYTWKYERKNKNKNKRTRVFRFLREVHGVCRNDFRHNVYFWVLFLRKIRGNKKTAGFPPP